eukprot:2599344-Pleurochrysis_carterae.AAC.1
MVKSWRVALAVCQCAFAGLLADGEAGREQGLVEPGGDGGGSGNGGPRSERVVVDAAPAGGVVVVLREYTRRRDSLR